MTIQAKALAILAGAQRDVASAGCYVNGDLNPAQRNGMLYLLRKSQSTISSVIEEIESLEVV